MDADARLIINPFYLPSKYTAPTSGPHILPQVIFYENRKGREDLDSSKYEVTKQICCFAVRRLPGP